MEAPGEIRRYRVLDVLGRGGFGTVYRAELLGAGGFTKIVALKLLHPEVEADARLLGRMRDEARMLGLLRHRAIVQVDGLVQLEGRQAVVMECVAGVTLDAAIRANGPLPPWIALRVVEEVADALAFAWDAPGPDGAPLRLLHRDIKPGNIQITPAGDVKLLDFGVARANFAGREANTQAMVYGSLPYLAPERLQRQDGPEGDIYALGATLLEALGGRLSGTIADCAETQSGRLEPALARLGQPGLSDLLRATLAFDPAARPPARELARLCRQLRRDAPGEDLRDWAERAIQPPPPGATDPLTGAVLAEQALAMPRAAQATFDDYAALASAPFLTHEFPPPDPPVVQSVQVPPPLPVEAAPPPPEPTARRAIPVRTATPAPAPRRAPPKPQSGGILSLLARLLFWTGVLAIVLAAVGAVGVFATGAAGVASFVALVAWMWPEVAADSCVDDITRMQGILRSGLETRASRQVSDHLDRNGIPDCRSGRVGVWEMVTFTMRIEEAAADKVITDFEARDILALYDQIRRP